jgi:hypothetical protein
MHRRAEVSDLQRIPWYEADPLLAERERARVLEIAPELVWSEDLELHDRRPRSGWVGPIPTWLAERHAPTGLDKLLEGDPLKVRVIYRESFPAAPPALYPTSVDFPLKHRTEQRWHVNGDGSLCQMQNATDWKPTDSAADLIVKASGWYVEYRLMVRGLIERMTIAGIHADDSLDEVIASLG